ncbi:amidohydrolase family protein [Carboxylicivirga taeanensis]|uniref:amidohydrolase family protein n=1 Tax=Carboxylicivirga taeanensis TaxID=1416875 RepID=UPI003F6E3EB8
MDYVLIKNGKVVHNGGEHSRDVLIGNDKIIDIRERIERPEPETPVIDAQGKYVLPGAVDTNILFSELIKQDKTALKRFNQAQVIGGTTTVIEPVLPVSSAIYQTELKRRRRNYYGISADYGFHLSMNGWKYFSERDIDFVYAHEGVASFYLKWPVEQSEVEQIKGLLKAAAIDSTPVMVDLHKPGEAESGFAAMSDVNRDTFACHLQHLQRIIDLALEVKCIICIMNVCFKEELDLIEAHASSKLVYAELMFPFHIADSDRIIVDSDSVFSGFPLVDNLNLISATELWQCLKKGNYFLARPMVKLSGQGIIRDSQVANRPDEYILLKNLLSVLYTLGVTQQNITLAELIELLACRPARFMGLYPKKGVVAVGSDADIIIWNLDYKRNLHCHLPGWRNEHINHFPLKGRVEFAFIKGHMVYDGESFSEEHVEGRYLYRSPSK